MSDDTELNNEPQEPQLDPAIELEAREQGWVPKELWHGKEEDWTDAAEFVRRGNEIKPILKKALEKERVHSAKLEKELTELKLTVKELAEHRAKIEEAAYKRAMADLKTQRREALQAGDLALADEVEEAIDQLKDEKPTVAPTKKDDPKAPVTETDPRIQNWINSNAAWYNDRPENEDMVVFANGLTAKMVNAARQRGEEPDPITILAETSKRVRQTFPEAFKTPPSMVDGGSQDGGGKGGGSGSKKGFATLPADAKVQFERFYKSGYYPNMKKEDAQAQYFADYE